MAVVRVTPTQPEYTPRAGHHGDHCEQVYFLYDSHWWPAI
jgi:hypothetical protein